MAGKSKHLVFTVTNDLSFDQRMDRICSALTDNGFKCTLIGRELNNSLPLSQKSYTQKRIFCHFEKGKIFYIEYNIKLFFNLLASRFDAVCAIDLDTAWPALGATLIRGKTRIFDAHEYFTELPEVLNRPVTKLFWRITEWITMRTFENAYTISEGYAQLFKKKYGKNLDVIRNVPMQYPCDPYTENEEEYIIYQGALNVGRGLEASILAMKNIEGLKLKIFGEGPLKSKLQEIITNQNLTDKVQLVGGCLPDRLRKFTQRAFAGLTLFDEHGLHHQHSLANRFFDYFHAEIPQIAVNYPEYAKFNGKYEVALLIETPQVELITAAVKQLQNDIELHQRLCKNGKLAAKDVNWKLESKKLLTIYNRIFENRIS